MSVTVRKMICRTDFFCSTLNGWSYFKLHAFLFPPLGLLDMRSFEYSSPSELDRSFFTEQSLLSALSLEQLSTSRASKADGSNATLSLQASLCLSLDPTSPSQALSFSIFNTQEVENCYLTVPLQGKFSTPEMYLQKQKKDACFEQMYSELNPTRMSWDVSLIKPESSSPKLCTESSAQEQMWSPSRQCSQHSLAEVSPDGEEDRASAPPLMLREPQVWGTDRALSCT